MRPARRVRVAAGLAGLQAGSADVPDVLLVPGYTGSKEDFAPLLDPLAAAGFTPLAIDLPGQYESVGPDDPKSYFPDRLADVLPHFAGHLLGHSFGGLVARAAVLADPTRFRSLTLMDSGPGAIAGARRAQIDQFEPVLLQQGMAGLYAAISAASASVPGFVAPPAAVSDFLRIRFEASSPVMLRGMGEALRTEPDRTSDLAAAGVPTLVLWGADDDAWPPAVQVEMAARLGARTAVIPDAAHSPAVENPGPTAQALIDFWRAVDAVRRP